MSSSLIRLKKIALQVATQNRISSGNNRRVYESDDVIEFYVGQNELQKPEATILNELRQKLPGMKMLDIGVGAGRTTLHFARASKEYLGIDYSSKMISACMKKFQDFPKTISFRTADARTMKLLEDRSFDFVLFSFNGIDYMDHCERINTLREIRRIIRKRGLFCFSTHNFNFLLKKCSLQMSKHPQQLADRLLDLVQMRLLNSAEMWKAIRNSSRNVTHGMVNDGAMDFRLKTYYILPEEQIRQLADLGFTKTRMYSLNTGKEFTDPGNWLDNWIYYLTEVS